jgi:hypothetical protein
MVTGGSSHIFELHEVVSIKYLTFQFYYVGKVQGAQCVCKSRKSCMYMCMCADII